MPSTALTVGELVAEQPSRSRVFSQLGIDFCCGGKQTLAEACLRHGLDVAEVQQLLVAQPRAPRDVDWRTRPTTELVAHIERTHHTFTKSELPRLAQLVHKVARVHGERHPAMIEVAELFQCFADELLAHLEKEERVLFPSIRAGAGSTMARPITVMLQDHDAAGEQMHRLRDLTAGFTPPEGACNTFRAALTGLAELEADLHVHVHLENNVLFPRVLAEVA